MERNFNTYKSMKRYSMNGEEVGDGNDTEIIDDDKG